MKELKFIGSLLSGVLMLCHYCHPYEVSYCLLLNLRDSHVYIYIYIFNGARSAIYIYITELSEYLAIVYWWHCLRTSFQRQIRDVHNIEF